MTQDGGQRGAEDAEQRKNKGWRAKDAALQPRSIILQVLGQRGPLTLAQLARAVQRSPLATRYHLDVLIAQGIVAPSHVAHRARVGRPQTLYALTPRAHIYLPHQYAWLAQQLLTELARVCGERELRMAFQRIGWRLAETLPLSRPTTRLRTRLRRAINFLCARGYAARTEQGNDGWAIIIHHCPYQQVARVSRAVCELDLALLDALVQVSFKMTRCIARQDAECVFVLSTRATRK